MGAGVLRLDDRQHADDRVHRQGHRRRRGGHLNVNRRRPSLLIGAVIWSYLGIIFEILTETVAWERWEGTIEYTFMAPLSRPVHLLGMGLFAVIYGVVRTGAPVRGRRAVLRPALADANFASALVLLAIASISFVGVGMMTAVLPLISPEKGAQLGFVAQGVLLVVSGVYYPVSVLPQWMQWIATISPATYALRGIRAAILDGAGLGALWGDIWPLLVIGVVAIPLGWRSSAPARATPSATGSSSGRAENHPNGVMPRALRGGGSAGNRSSSTGSRPWPSRSRA